ncbi:metallophosphoesterase [Shewanella sp. DW31]|jgi:3',5'-cyclic AMP phosphodiesterase CpdA|uniref:metallophosphoesterase family protein n=1 Tax=Shewanella sp. DW31 TaxID=2699422 RepID=UPI000DEA0FE1|nr:metallophosphoesterase [Shewanella sp. DW31]MBI1676155.1 metallophosphoesterase [Shewanella sp. DW31]RBP82933.1 3',5'-cyclic AMP phosphodiesterase CpdA [Shewanella putrefaciens]
MLPNVLKIAVVSDLHFVNTENVKNGTHHSWLTFESDGSFNDGFWLSLLEKIKTDEIRADLLVCPGDITTHAESKALKFAWSKLNELAEALGCKFLATATGNHDVNSRSKPIDNVVRDLERNNSPVEHLKHLEPAYPLVDINNSNSQRSHNDRVHYFGSDFLLYDDSDEYRLVILNSCGAHTADPIDYERGTISESTLKWLEKSLQNINANHNKKLGILVCHHHPVLHSDHKLGTYDFMRGGQSLLEMLNKYGKWIIVHGHKHHAKLTYHSVGSEKTIIFAAGTLSAHKLALGDDFANQFYILNIDMNKKRGTPKGTLDVYSWQANCWSLSKRTKDGVFTGVGFGDVGCLEELADKIEDHLLSVTSTPWDAIVRHFPELSNCVPHDLKNLEAYLQERNIDLNRTPDSEFESLEKSRG